MQAAGSSRAFGALGMTNVGAGLLLLLLFLVDAGGRDVGVVASDGDADVAVGADQDRQARC
jgi:hypothetical protein